VRTIDRVKKKFIDGGIDNVLERRSTGRVYETIVDGGMEAKLVTLYFSEPPKGFAK